MRRLALEITAAINRDARTGLPDRRDFGAIAAAVYEWMKRSIAYVHDPHDVEQLQDPTATLELRSGDCDDMAILGAVILQSLGVPTRLQVIRQHGYEDFNHILLQYEAGGVWRPFDVTLGERAGAGPPLASIAESRTIGLGNPGNRLRARHSAPAVIVSSHLLTASGRA